MMAKPWTKTSRLEVGFPVTSAPNMALHAIVHTVGIN